MVGRGCTVESKKFMQAFQSDHQKIYDGELKKLSCITSAIHLKDNNIANTFRNNKYNLQLSSYSFELFISFLQENQFHVILKIVNQYLNIKGKRLNSCRVIL